MPQSRADRAALWNTALSCQWQIYTRHMDTALVCSKRGRHASAAMWRQMARDALDHYFQQLERYLDERAKA